MGRIRVFTNNSYIAPSYKSDGFNCPICKAFSQQNWNALFINPDCGVSYLPNYSSVKDKGYKGTESPNYSVVGAHSGSSPSTKQDYTRLEGFALSECQRCKTKSVWVEDKLVYPLQSTAPFPNEDMPGDVKEDFMEARNIVELSPRAAALLRLATQRLVILLGGDSKSNINDNIQFLVDNKGLPIRIQRALDVLRVVGNEAVHPGTIDVDDKEIVISLFNWVNDIVTTMITNEKLINEHYQGLPPDKLKGIEDRSKRAQAASKTFSDFDKTK